jgi:hypothetical protein
MTASATEGDSVATRLLSSPQVIPVGAVLLAGAFGAALAFGPLVVAVAVLAISGAVALAVVPRHWLWSIALCVSALIPIQSLPVPHILEVLSPAMIVVAVLAVRTVLGGRSTPFFVGPQLWLVLALTCWLIVTVVLSIQKGTALGWMVNFLFLVVLPVVIGFGDRRAGRVIESTWIVVGAVLGSYALLEAFVLHANPVYGGMFASGPSHLTQNWSIYRATTTLGHPVVNGLFFVVAVPLALARMVARDRLGWAVLATALAAGGVIASGTRTAFLAALLSAAVVLFGPTAATMRTRGGVGVRLLVLGAMLLTLVAGIGYLSARNTSAEGSTSDGFRTAMISVARDGVTESPVVGVGPGVASVRWQRWLTGTNGGAGAFESLWLEIVVGTGLPGLALTVAVFATAIGTALRGRATMAAAALAGYLITASGFNVWEGGRPGHVRLGLLLVMAFAVARPVRSQQAQPAARLAAEARMVPTLSSGLE